MTDLDVYQPPAQPEQYQAGITMTPQQAKALDDQLTQCIKAILREGTDYGIIPGTKEKSLWRPGAQKLLLWFGLGFTCERVDIDADEDGQRLGVTYRATVKRRLPDGSEITVTTCEGYAGYDEDKFYQSAEQVQAKAEDRERHWAKKDGRVANPTKWQNLPEYRAPWNSVIKRAQKRAIVGATLDATAAGGRFNQDREEDDHAPVAQDDGPTWYEQGIQAALTFTDVDAARALYVGAAEAHRQGLCSRRQQDHIQNTIRQRVQLIETVKIAETEDLAGKAAAEHAQDAAEDSQDPIRPAVPAAGSTATDSSTAQTAESPSEAEDTLPVEDPPDWPEVTKPGTGTPKGK